MNYKKEAEEYLKQNPKCMKWINSCPICGTIGCKPDMPEFDNSNNLFFKNLRTFFNLLEVDERGVCLQCSKLFK